MHRNIANILVTNWQSRSPHFRFVRRNLEFSEEWVRQLDGKVKREKKSKAR